MPKMEGHEAELPERPTTIRSLVAEWSRTRADQRLGRLTATEADETIRLVANALSRRTRATRPVITYEAPAGVDGALLFLAAASVGVAAPLRSGMTAAEISAAIELISPDLHIDPSADLVTSLRDEGAHLPASHETDHARETDLALILTTSGTTGPPKRVGLTHATLTASARNIASSFALTPADHALTVMPLFHIHGLVAGILAPIAGGGSVTPVAFDAFAFGRYISDVQPTWCSAVPSMWEMILSRWSDRPDDLRSSPWRFLRTSSSALPATLMQRLEDVFDVPVLEAYGMTEAAHQIAANPLPPGRRAAHSVGFATGDTQIRITKPNAAGEGQIEVKGSTIISGYLTGESATSFDNGWFATGDQGRLDADGRLFITGRISEFINRGGDKISPHEIERALATHPDVERVVAFPLDHELLGQVPGAAVVLRSGSSTTVEELRAHIKQLLSRPKRPKRLEIVDSWPLGPTGKLQRASLAHQLGWS